MKKLAFVCESFEIGSAAQQLLDRCLFGWPMNGTVREAPFETVSVFVGNKAPALDQRRAVSHLDVASSLDAALNDADAWILASGKEDNPTCCSAYLRHLAGKATPTARGWVTGLPAGLSAEGLTELKAANASSLNFQAGGPLPFTWRLPEVDVPKGAKLKEALILIRGAFPVAEQEAVEAVLALTSQRPGGESGIARMRRLEGSEVWKAAKDGLFDWNLFASAISRSNSTLGDATRDGRTQDIVGLGMVPSLAKGTRAWIIDHLDGMKSVIITADGIVNDDHFAVHTNEGTIVSAQFYRPPKPNDHQYSRLMDRMIDWMEHGTECFPLNRTCLWIALIDSMKHMQQNALDSMAWQGPSYAYEVTHSAWNR